MQVRKLLEKDDAVSPVIGVILMVAITVILAAVIASFVLGLGDQASQTTPQASFSFDYTQGEGPTFENNLTITHDGGDSIKEEELFIRGNGFNTTEPDDGTGTSIDTCGSGSIGFVMCEAGQWAGDTSGEKGDSSAVVAGDDVKVHVNSDYEIRVVFQSSEGDNSATLGQDTGPDA